MHLVNHDSETKYVHNDVKTYGQRPGVWNSSSVYNNASSDFLFGQPGLWDWNIGRNMH